jgi:hypothetical protein
MELTTDMLIEMRRTLMSARSFIDSPATWTKEHTAVNAYGEPVHFRDRSAKRWSLLAAIYLCNPTDTVAQACERLLDSSTQIGGHGKDPVTRLIRWEGSISTSHAQVMEVFAISLCLVETFIRNRSVKPRES